MGLHDAKATRPYLLHRAAPDFRAVEPTECDLTDSVLVRSGEDVSWQVACLRHWLSLLCDSKVLALEAPYKCVFDMCLFGLRSPNGVPIQKRTCFLTNSLHVYRRFNGQFCKGHHSKHERIQGSQEGIRLSTWCQYYPKELCEAIADCAVEDYRSIRARLEPNQPKS